MSIHVRLSNRTRGMLDRVELTRMTPGAISVNTSRGEIVAERALLEASAARAGAEGAG